MDDKRPEEIPSSSLRRSNTPLIVIALLVVFAGAGFMVWNLVGKKQLEGAAAQIAAAPSITIVDGGPVDGLEARVEPGDADAMLKTEATSLSSMGEVGRWLAEPGMVRRLVAAVAQVAEGLSPKDTLGFLRPEGEFTVVERNGTVYMSEESTARFDEVTRILDSVDAAAVGQLYSKLRKFADAAFREIGKPGARFDQVLSSAIEKLSAVPIVDAELEVRAASKGVGYEFVDPELESLSPAQKALLRMGPANARVVVRKLRAFEAAATR